MSQADDARWMTLALGLAARGLGNVWPNPAVGCVIVNNGVVVGRGWTQPGGRPHGETVAIRRAAHLAKGATAYVTLEPCAHHGKTPPCANALIDAGIARVVSATQDPDPRVSGKGHELLRQGGVDVAVGCGRAAACQINQGFVSRIESGRPFVSLKLAASVDGRIATVKGESKWITGTPARRYVHALRATHDAVLVGAGTVRADDPSLTVRGLGISRQPVRVVVSRHLDLPLDSQLGTSAHEVALWLCHGPDIDEGKLADWHKSGAETIACEIGEDGMISPQSIMRELAARGLTRVFCEGGSHLAAALIRADLVDELSVFNSGLVIGGDGLTAVGPIGVENLADAKRYIFSRSQQIGDDHLQIWKRPRQ